MLSSLHSDLAADIMLDSEAASHIFTLPLSKTLTQGSAIELQAVDSLAHLEIKESCRPGTMELPTSEITIPEHNSELPEIVNMTEEPEPEASSPSQIESDQLPNVTASPLEPSLSCSSSSSSSSSTSSESSQSTIYRLYADPFIIHTRPYLKSARARFRRHWRLTVFGRWRQRKKSERELHREEKQGELLREYERMREMEKKWWNNGLPWYEEATREQITTQHSAGSVREGIRRQDS